MQNTYTFRMGRRGEIIAAALFGSESWGIVPTAELGGGNRAPMHLKLDAHSTILPDLDISKFGAPRMWVDAKTKSRFFIWRKTRQSQTGIEVSHLQHYRRIEQLTGAPVVLCMINKETGDVLCNTLSGLGEPRLSPADDYPMANWDMARFHRLWRVNPQRLKTLLEHDTMPPPISREMMHRTLDYLRAQRGDQGELPLFHSDVFAALVRLGAGRPMLEAA